jgi:DNA topoisomerase-1
MRLRTGRNGTAFLGCTAYPKCRNAISVAIQGGKAEARPDEPTGEKCPACGGDLVRRHGRFGEYVSCANYPNCRYKPPKPVTLTGVTCPECNLGRIVERRGRFGPFYGCSRYPECTRNFRARPVPKPCPKCGTAYLLVRDRKAGPFYVCEAEGCGYEAPAEDLDRYTLQTEVTEEARQAALAAAAAPAPRKKSPRPKREAAEGVPPKTTATDEKRAGRADGARKGAPTGRKRAAAARPRTTALKR